MRRCPSAWERRAPGVTDSGIPGRALGVKRSALSIFISVRTASRRRLLKLQEVSYRLSRTYDVVVPVIRGFVNVEVLTECFSAGRGYDLVSEIGEWKEKVVTALMVLFYISQAIRQ